MQAFPGYDRMFCRSRTVLLPSPEYDRMDGMEEVRYRACTAVFTVAL